MLGQFTYPAVTIAPGGGFVPAALLRGTLFPFLSITEDVAAMLRQHGHNPADYNRVVWPTGASRYGHGRFLMAGSRLEAFIAAEPDVSSCTLIFGSVVFDRMAMLRPTAVFNAEGSGPVYAVELVDERYYWDDVVFDPGFGGGTGEGVIGFNVTGRTKTSIWASTGDPDNMVEVQGDGGPIMQPGPWTIQGAIYRALDLSSIEWQKNEFEIESLDFGSIEDPILSRRWRDFNVQGMNVPEVIDRLLAMAGRVLVACPSPGQYPVIRTTGADPVTPPSGGPRYVALPIEIGDSVAVSTSAFFAGQAVYGGFTTGSDEQVALPSGSLKWRPDAARETFNAAVPSVVAVQFPVWGDRGTGWTSEPGSTGGGLPIGPFQTTKYTERQSAEGRPISPGAGITTVHSTAVALYPSDGVSTDFINEAELLDEAAAMARVYYARFKGGIANLGIRGIQRVPQWPGAGVITWRLGADFAVTQLDGLPDDPLFGFDQRRPLTQQHVEAVGDVRAYQRPGGGILLDGQFVERSRLYLGRITAVYPDATGNNATYDAVAVFAPCDGSQAGPLCVVDGTPERYHPASVDIVPAAVGDWCIIGDTSSSAGTNPVFWLAERPVTVDCADVGAAAEATQAGPGLPRGTDPRLYQIHGL